MLAELIDKIRAVVDGQFDEADHAMLAHGDLQLQPVQTRHKLTIDIWTSLFIRK